MNTLTHASPVGPALMRANPLFPPPIPSAPTGAAGGSDGLYARAAQQPAAAPMPPAPLEFASALDTDEAPQEPRSRFEDALRAVFAYGVIAFGMLFPVFVAVYASIMR